MADSHASPGSDRALNRSTPLWRWLRVNLAVALLYAVSAWLGLQLAITPGFASAFWPPSGIALAAVMVWGAGVAPGVFLGAALPNLLVSLSFHEGVGLGASLLSTATIGLGSFLQPLLGAMLLRRCSVTPDITRSLRDLSIFLMLVPLFCTVSATVGNLSLVAGGQAAWSDVPNMWITWWLGDSAGVVIMAPFLLSLVQPPIERVRARGLERLVVTIAIVGLGWYVFARPSGSHGLVNLHLPFFLLVWAALRSGVRSTTLALVLLDLIAVVAGARTIGPFLEVTDEAALLSLQLFIVMQSVLVLLILAIARERSATEQSAEERGQYNRTLFEQSPVGLALCRMDGQLVDVNPAFAGILGCDVEEAKGLTYWQITPEKYAEQEAVQLASLHAHGHYGPYQKEYLHRDGHLVPVVLNGQLQVLGGETFILSSVQDLTALQLLRSEHEARDRRIHRHNDCLVGLSRQQVIADGDVEAAGRMITETVAGAIEVDRVSIWLTEPGGRLVCQDLFDLASGAHEQGKVLLAEEFPAYFGALERERVIDASDARHDPRTAELTDPYLQSHAIYSLLDAPIRLAGKVVGVLSLEQCNAIREWHEDETGFAGGVGDLVLQLLANRRRRQDAENIRLLNESLEQKVAERTVQLEESIRDLDGFVYLISHDLRAPLRGIIGYTELLMSSLADCVDEHTLEDLRRIHVGGEHMNTLLDDLLRLSRLSRQEMRLEAVDLSELARFVTEGLRASDPVRSVEVTIEPGMTARGDRVLLRTVVENLLGNAWKFTGKQPEPRIEFGQTCGDGMAVYFVRDNGTGFDMAYADKLFEPFERLHTDDQFSGSGVGLNSVKRILERHGGKIWAEAVEGQGATFFFTVRVSPNGGTPSSIDRVAVSHDELGR